MREHWRDDTYQLTDGGRVVVACTCGWRSAPIVPERDPQWDSSWFGAPPVTDATLDRLDNLWQGHIGPLVEVPPDQRLVLSEDGGGPRYFLAGEPVYTGGALEMLMPGGVWLSGRLEVEHGTADPWGPDRSPLPIFYTSVGGPAAANDVPEYVQQVHFVLPPRAVLRRPLERAQCW